MAVCLDCQAREDPMTDLNFTFDIWFPGPPATFGVFLILLGVFLLIWLVKFLISMYSGAGAG